MLGDVRARSSVGPSFVAAFGAADSMTSASPSTRTQKAVQSGTNFVRASVGIAKVWASPAATCCDQSISGRSAT